MPSQPIQSKLDLVVKEAIADAEAVFLKSFLSGVDDNATLGDIFSDLLGLPQEEIFGTDGIGEMEVQAIKGLLAVKISEIKLERRKKTKNGHSKKRTRRSPPKNKPKGKGGAEHVAESEQ